MIDLRSDTVTRPTDEMRMAMRDADVGDDIMGDDYTTKRLEAEAASIFGFDAALFVPTGTMGNMVSAMSHCQGATFPEMIVGHKQHTYMYEVGNMARIGGIHSWVLKNQPDGTLDLEEIESAIREKDQHYPTTKLISLENTHNSCGGVPLSAQYIDQVARIANKHDIKLHIDGARIFNAATYFDTPVSALCRNVDSVTFCLSKGLGAPAGSLVLGSRSFIDNSRVVRKAMGGSMRQVGILASAGLIAMNVMSKRLGDDHEMASKLGRGLAAVEQLQIDPSRIKTNMFFMGVADGKANDLVNVLRTDYKILVGAYGNEKIRIVTHHQVPGTSASYIIDSIKGAVRQVFNKK